jgi:hypothetical protein
VVQLFSAADVQNVRLFCALAEQKCGKVVFAASVQSVMIKGFSAADVQSLALICADGVRSLMLVCAELGVDMCSLCEEWWVIL